MFKKMLLALEELMEDPKFSGIAGLYEACSFAREVMMVLIFLGHSYHAEMLYEAISNEEMDQSSPFK